MIPEVEFELNYTEPDKPPTLVATRLLEERLDFRLNYSGRAKQKTLDRYAIHIHAFHPEIFELLLEQITANCNEFDLYITTDIEEKKELILSTIASKKPPLIRNLEIQCVANQGRNIGALSCIYEKLVAYPLVLHIHTKKSPHCAIGEAWLKDLLLCLAGSKSQTNAIRVAFQNHSKLGLIMPRPYQGIRPYANWGKNYEYAEEISKQIFSGKSPSPYSPLIFPTGMMFWFRPPAIRKLMQPLANCLTFPLEPLSTDGTSLHAIERLVAHCCEAEGFSWALCNPENALTNREIYKPAKISVWEEDVNPYINAASDMATKLRTSEDRIRVMEQSLKWQIRALLRRLFLGTQAA